MPEIKSVSLHQFTVIGDVLYAVCMRRGPISVERSAVAYWPYGVQPFIHGKMELADRGEPYRCLMREADEEGGPRFAEAVRSQWASVGALPMEAASTVQHYHFLREANQLFPLLVRSEGIILIDRRTAFSDQIGVLDASNKMDMELWKTIAMFPDDLDAMRKSFDALV